MLHIILLILKIIGILILAVIGLVLIITAILLFCPLKYSADVSFHDSFQSVNGGGKFHWLYHIVNGSITVENGTVLWKVKAGWKKFGNENDLSDESEDSSEGSSENSPIDSKEGAAEDLLRKSSEGSSSDSMDNASKGSKEELSEDTMEISAEDLEESSTDDDSEKRPVEKDESDAADMAAAGGEEKTSDTPSKDSENKKQADFSSEKKKEPESKYEKIINKIKYTIQRLCDKIKSLAEKKDKVTGFITDEVHRSAFCKLMKETLWLCRKLKPRYFAADVEFGFDDPSVTGYVLAAVSMVYPIFGESLSVTPDFQEKVLRGSVKAKGKLRLFHLSLPVVKLIIDKEIRTTYKHFKAIKL